MRLVSLLLFFGSLASAQDEIVAISNWRVHDGDNPAWARPDFDDSSWAPGELAVNSRSSTFHPGRSWYRAAVSIPPVLAGRNLAIGMGPLDEVYEIFVEGVSVGRFGHWTPRPAGPVSRDVSFRIPARLLQGTIAHVAVRRWVGGSSTAWLIFWVGSGRPGYPAFIGPATAIETLERLHLLQGGLLYVPWIVTFLLVLVAGAASFAFYSLQRARVEYLILGIYCFCFGAPPLLAIALLRGGDSIMLRSPIPFALMALFQSTSALAVLIVSRICKRLRRFLVAAAAALSVGELMLCTSLLTQIEWTAAFWANARPLVQPAVLLIAVWSLWRERAWGALCIAASMSLMELIEIVQILAPGFGYFDVGPMWLDLRSFGLLATAFSALTVFYLRFRDEQIRQAQLDEDFAAARRMQAMLLGPENPSTPGYSVDVAYRPARHVGGDFHQQIPGGDGSLLTVVGDVSGKGLPAAMLVSTVIGALADLPSRRPAEVLAHLNRALAGRARGGFVTCCAALIHREASVEIANAGHIPPWLGPKPLEIEGGLPLGIAPDVDYAQHIFPLDGQVLTMLSDGVIEARNAQGELFGFERTQAAIGQSAAQIAKKAEDFGQDDDIMVVTVRRAGVYA